MSYKLNYFNIRGVAEPIRLIFKYAEVKFEDNRIEKENWPAIKETFPWGQLPTLEIDNGVVIAQSLAISRYLARKFNLVGGDELESAKCDELVDALMDFQKQVTPAFRETDEEKKFEMKVKMAEEQVPKFFDKFNSILEKNGGKFLVGKGITWADLFYFNAVCYLDDFLEGQDIMDNYPLIHEYLETIFRIPQIKTYIALRPHSLI